MKKKNKTLLIIAIASVVAYLIYRKRENNGTGNTENPYFPSKFTNQQIKDFQQKYLVFVIDGRTYYAHKSGKYSSYAYSPHNNKKFVKRFSGVNHFYPGESVRIAPTNVSYNGKEYTILIENVCPDKPDTGGWSEIEDGRIVWYFDYPLFPELNYISSADRAQDYD